MSEIGTNSIEEGGSLITGCLIASNAQIIIPGRRCMKKYQAKQAYSWTCDAVYKRNFFVKFNDIYSQTIDNL